MRTKRACHPYPSPPRAEQPPLRQSQFFYLKKFFRELLAALQGLRDLSSPARDQTCALGSESRVLTTGLPGESPEPVLSATCQDRAVQLGQWIRMPGQRRQLLPAFFLAAPGPRGCPGCGEGRGPRRRDQERGSTSCRNRV